MWLGERKARALGRGNPLVCIRWLVPAEFGWARHRVAKPGEAGSIGRRKALGGVQGHLGTPSPGTPRHGMA